jgi:hypothetical protein
LAPVFLVAHRLRRSYSYIIPLDKTVV